MKDLDNRIVSIFTLLLNKNSHGNCDMRNLYELVDDMDTFLKIVSRFNGRKVQFPTLKEVEDSLTTALVYYYREQGYTWKEIRAIMPVSFSPEGYSMKIKSLNSFILKSLKETMKEDDKSRQI